MESNFKKTPLKFTQKKVSRRVLLKNMGKTVLAVGAAVAVGAVWGAQYDSYDPQLGGPIMKDGEGYGKWFEINGDDLIVFDSDQNKIDTYGKKLYMAGNFLRLPKENEVDNVPNARP